MTELNGFGAVVVGCGLVGGLVARHLAESGRKVVILERRNHIAGNMYDYINDQGILVQKYGPHTFHTRKKELFKLVCKYSSWKNYRVNCKVDIYGKQTPSPFNFQTIDDYYPQEKAEEIKKHLLSAYPGAETVTIVELLGSSDPIIKEYADFLFAEDYSLYTAKQWGISPSEIDISVLKRVPVRLSYKDGYFDDEFQVMPENGFTEFFKNIISHENITVMLNTNALEHISIVNEKLLIDGEEAHIPVIYTGEVDELLRQKFGALPYRSLRFEIRHEDTDSYQDAPIVAYPRAEGFTRITEYTKMPPQTTSGKTVIAVEYPQPYEKGRTEPYYPILTENSIALYQQYKTAFDNIPHLYLCGRLADFKYYNMDQAIERAVEICGIIDKEEIN